MITLDDCLARDRADPLGPLRDRFELPDGVIYLDGNSLGALPRGVSARVAEVVSREWGHELIQSWNAAGWFELPRRVGDRIAMLIGARAGEVVAADTTSVNLYKALSAALDIARQDAPDRHVVVSERSNFPTDLYIAEALCRERDCTLRLIEPHEVAQSLTTDVAVLMLTQVNYRTGALHDMARVTAAAHAVGALTVWDLCHSAGAVPVDLHGAKADFAVGCTYKYLNGGPGSPAFVWVNPRHVRRCWQPLAGWWGHAEPFAFTPEYQPAMDITRYQCGTQPIISLAALDAALDVFDAAHELGGMAALRTKSLALTDLFIELIETQCADQFELVTPRAHARRGSQVCLTPTEQLPAGSAYAIVQALIARGVIGDFRAGDAQQPDIVRLGFTPLYLRHADVWNAARHLHELLAGRDYLKPEFNRRQAVT